MAVFKTRFAERAIELNPVGKRLHAKSGDAADFLSG